MVAVVITVSVMNVDEKSPMAVVIEGAAMNRLKKWPS